MAFRKGQGAAQGPVLGRRKEAFKAQPQEGPVYFCGDCLIGPNTGAALASGWQCADRVMEALG